MNFITALLKNLSEYGWTMLIATILDIFLVTCAVYWLIMLSKKTRAWQIIIGLCVFLGLVVVTEKFQLHTLNYLLKSFLPLGPVAIAILFYPELRNALENMGRLAGWGRGLTALAREEITMQIPKIVKAVCDMSSKRIGAIIVVERESALDDIAATGTKLNSMISQDLIGAIFYPGNPLHDGAAIIRGTRILAAGCTLPLTESVHVTAAVHTRHKAALGISEITDAVAVVVSEETGTISIALEGKLHRGLTEETLTKWLKTTFGIFDQRSGKNGIARTVDGTLRKARLRNK